MSGSTPQPVLAVSTSVVRALLVLAGMIATAFVVLYVVSSAPERQTLLDALVRAWPAALTGGPAVLAAIFAGKAHTVAGAAHTAAAAAEHNTNGALAPRVRAVVAEELDRRGLVAPDEDDDVAARAPALDPSSSDVGATVAVPAAPTSD